MVASYSYGFQISDPSRVCIFLNQELMKLKCRHFVVLTFVVQQLLLLDDLSLGLSFCFKQPLVIYVEVQESPDIFMTYNYLSLLVCTTLLSVKYCANKNNCIITWIT